MPWKKYWAIIFVLKVILSLSGIRAVNPLNSIVTFTEIVLCPPPPERDWCVGSLCHSNVDRLLCVFVAMASDLEHRWAAGA